MKTTARGLRAARWYVDHWRVRVLPTKPGQRCALVGSTGRGHQAASDDSAVLDEWWRRWPHAEAAVLNTNRVLLLDEDAKHGVDGRETLRDLEERYGVLPDAPTATTPHGGEHRYFRSPGGIRSSVAKLGAGVDIRGDGSLLFPPPCRGYAYLIGFSAADVELPELPQAWVVAIRRLDDMRGEGKPFCLPDILGKGERNDTLFRYACSMRARQVKWELLASAVRKANRYRCKPALKEREVAAILDSVECYMPGKQAA